MENGSSSEAPSVLALNLPLARQYHSLLTQLRKELGISGEVTLEMMAGFRDLFVTGEGEEDVPALWEGLEKVLAQTMEKLTAMRDAEGESLGRDLTERMGTVERLVQEIARRAPEVVLEYRQRLADRVRELTAGMVVDESRLHQEVAVLAEKSDITEEVVRMNSHLGQFRNFMTAEEAVGRKMDFLIQEMNREVNTIGAKSQDGEIARLVIEIKSELAKLREQIQNVE